MSQLEYQPGLRDCLHPGADKRRRLAFEVATVVRVLERRKRLLTKLEERLATANLDVQLAAFRLAQARAQLGATEAAAGPRSNANASATRIQQSTEGVLATSTGSSSNGLGGTSSSLSTRANHRAPLARWPRSSQKSVSPAVNRSISPAAADASPHSWTAMPTSPAMMRELRAGGSAPG